MKNEQFVITEGRVPFQVRAESILVGNDLIVLVYGGEEPHVGAVAISIPRPSLKDNSIISSTTSVFALPGHKEDDLSKSMAHKIAAKLNRNTLLAAGIHIDNITDSGIKEVEKNCNKLLERLINYYLKL